MRLPIRRCARRRCSSRTTSNGYAVPSRASPRARRGHLVRRAAANARRRITESRMRRLLLIVVGVALGAPALSAQAPAPITAIRAGRLLDPDGGRVLTNQIILVEGTRIRDVGPNVAIPA